MVIHGRKELNDSKDLKQVRAATQGRGGHHPSGPGGQSIKTKRLILNPCNLMGDFPGGTGVKNPSANAGDTGSIPGPGRSHVPRSNWAQVRHNYWACTLEPARHNYWACVLQLLKPMCLEPVLCNKRNLHLPQLEEACVQQQRPNAAKKLKLKIIIIIIKQIIQPKNNLMELALLGFGFAWDPWSFSSLWFLPFGMGISTICLSYHCILEADSLFGFTGSQLERNLASDESYLESRVSPMLDLHDR